VAGKFEKLLPYFGATFSRSCFQEASAELPPKTPTICPENALKWSKASEGKYLLNQ